VSVVVACTSSPRPQLTQRVAGETSVPESSIDGSPTPTPAETDFINPEPSPPGETAPPTSIVPGAVDRTSLLLTASYHVNAAITVKSGGLDVTTRIQVRNDSGDGIDRLELNTIAARLGGMRIYAATVDDAPATVAVRDQTVTIALGGVLPSGSTTTVSLAYRATLRTGLTGSDWMFSRSGGTLAMYRWIPWLSAATPFDRPNDGEPFVTVSSPQVDVELLADQPLVLAAPSADVDEFAAGSGLAWSFSVQNVRDVSVVLAPDFRVARATANGIPIRAFTRPGGAASRQLADLAAAAIALEGDRLGMAYPATALVLVETPGGGSGIESPGLLWVPRGLDTRNRTYAIYQGVAHQWFYGLVGNDQRTEPFADEAPADLLARTVLGTLRASRCGRDTLDDAITAYSRGCYREVVFVQGGKLLDDLRRRMGTDRFWAALRTYLEANRNGIAGTKALLEALRDASPVDLLPLLRPRFPDLY
jgi:hypothetical protein